MQPPEIHPPQFYFSLPRLVAKLRGRSPARTESNWMEANAVGTVIFGISYIVASRLLARGLPLAAQFALAVPVLVGTYFSWMLLLYANSLALRLLRGCGLMRELPDARAQSILIGLTTSAFAYHLLGASGWMRLLGAAWLIAVSVNLAAAFVLVVTRADA